MQLPSFDEFLAELKGKDHDFLKKLRSQEEPSNIKKALELSVQANIFATFEVLELYHKWLSQHLELQNQADR